MEENGAEELGQLGGSGGTIQLALSALKDKQGSVDQVRTGRAKQSNNREVKRERKKFYSRSFDLVLSSLPKPFFCKVLQLHRGEVGVHVCVRAVPRFYKL